MASARQVLDLAISERDFQAQIVQLAEMLGWCVWHDPDPPFCRRCNTVVLDRRRPGWPDLTLVRGHHLLFWELKSERGRIAPAQRAAIERLQAVEAVGADIIRPSDWTAIEALLVRAGK